MTDRELLQKAAKAAGYTLDEDCDRTDVRDNGGGPLRWNPLEDDGDALRLAVTLRIDVYTLPINSEAVTVTAKHRMRSDLLRQPNPTASTEMLARDPYAATRRAIVRAAAEMADAAGAA